MPTFNPGDLVLALRQNGEIARGQFVTVAEVRAGGDYLTFEELGGRRAYRADTFLLVVRPPWWAWAEPGWPAQARAAVEGFMRGGLVAGAVPVVTCTATIGPDSDDPHVYHCDRKTPHRYLHSTGPEGEEIAWWCSCPDCASPRDADLTTAPVETAAEIRAEVEELRAAIREWVSAEDARHVGGSSYKLVNRLVEAETRLRALSAREAIPVDRRSVACPTCRAAPGQPCTGSYGTLAMTVHHRSRIAAATGAAAPGEGGAR